MITVHKYYYLLIHLQAFLELLIRWFYLLDFTEIKNDFNLVCSKLSK